MKKKKNKFSRGLCKYIRHEKARIRRENADKEEQIRLIKELYKRLRP